MSSDPINVASDDFLKQLAAIEPGVYGTPCSVVLKDGSSFETCLAWKNPRYSDKGDWIHPEKVAFIVEAPSRMPARFARLFGPGEESGMGYILFVVELADGTSFVQVGGGGDIDFLNLPPGYTQKDVVDVLPHAGREQSSKEGYRLTPKFASLEYCRPPFLQSITK